MLALITMGWKEYYEKTIPCSLQDQLPAYRLAVRFIREKAKNLLDPQRKMTFVLGGFHPLSGTAQAFRNFCSEIHPNPKDRHILLDMNLLPLLKLGRYLVPDVIQAKLEELPFKGGTVDFFILDFTLDFMNNQQVQGFAQRAADCLAPNGLIIAALNEPLVTGWPQLARFSGYLANRVKTFPRSRKQIVNLLSPYLRPLLFIESEIKGSPSQVILLGKNNNPDFPKKPFFASTIAP